MQTMRFNKLLLLLLIVLSITSCRKDDVSEPVTTTTIPPFEVIHTFTVDVQGIVKNPNGDVISDAIVNVNGQQVVTSENGVFLLEKLEAPQSGLYLNADASGYFEGGTSIYAHKNQVYTVEITLVPLENYQSFDAGSGLNYVSDDGAFVSIPADGIIDEQGNKYNGTVDFYTYWINPTDDNLANLSPGSLVGELDNELVALQSFGMIAVEMTGSAGQELNLADGTKADLSFPIPSEMISIASAEINLWHFNEVTGRWDSEGTASLVNGKYEAQVSHFSWWNCDVPFNSAFFCFYIEDSFGDPVGNLTLDVFAQNFGYASANIDPSGTYCDLVPVGQVMEVTLSTHCGDVIWSAEITAGAGSDDVTIEVPLGTGEIDLVNVSGTVTCGDTDIVDNGYVVLSVGTQTYLDYVDENGNYEINIINCLDADYDGTLTAYNLDELLGGSDPITVGQEDIEADIDACEDDLTQEIFLMSGTQLQNFGPLFHCEANISVAEITIIAKDPLGVSGDYVILGVKGFDEGNFFGNIFSNASGFSTPSDTALDQIEIEIELYTDVPGEQIIGNFSYGADFHGDFVATVK